MLPALSKSALVDTGVGSTCRCPAVHAPLLAVAPCSRPASGFLPLLLRLAAAMQWLVALLQSALVQLTAWTLAGVHCHCSRCAPLPDHGIAMLLRPRLCPRGSQHWAPLLMLRPSTHPLPSELPVESPRCVYTMQVNGASEEPACTNEDTNKHIHTDLHKHTFHHKLLHAGGPVSPAPPDAEVSNFEASRSFRT